MVRTRINEHFAQPFCFFHGGKKIDGGLRGTGVFAAGNDQDGALDFVEAEPVRSRSPLPGRSDLH